MKARLPKPVYQSLIRTINNGERLDPSIAELLRLLETGRPLKKEVKEPMALPTVAEVARRRIQRVLSLLEEDLTPTLAPWYPGRDVFSDEVVEARAKATSIQATPELVNNPEAFNKFQAAQGELSSALSRLLVVTENYPNLKANQGFQDLRVQLEGTENRITVARGRYVKAVQDYNVAVRSFPSNLTAMVFGYGVKANFTVTDEAALAVPPKVDLGGIGASGAKK